MARSSANCRKRNKRARNTKLRWIKQKLMQTTPKIFDDVEMDSVVTDLLGVTTHQVINDSSQELQDSTTNQSGENENVLRTEFEVESIIKNNPYWCHKTYSARFPRKRSFCSTGMMTPDEYNSIVNHELETEKVFKEDSPIVGNRIVELGYVLQWSITLQYDHSKICTSGKIYVDQEKRRNNGLVSTIVFKCTMCSRIYKYDTENPDKAVSDINYGSVWGTLSTGSSYTHMSEFFACMDIPGMPDSMFYNIENEAGKEWRTSLWHSMEAAGEKEKLNAVEKGQICPDGTPWITVYVDGSWSKRSYGSNFNSLSGMIGIIGRHTGQVLFIGIKNKFCSICVRAETKNESPKNHVCYKNWNESAPSMESAMAVEGFSLSEEMHGIRYTRFIADGDASVFAKIKEKVPYGSCVRKIECTNHALKNYGKHLRKIKSDKHIDVKGRKLLTIQKIKLLTKRAKCCIYEHSKSEDRNLNLFRQDLRNNVHHVFGDHTKCREGTCNSVGEHSETQIPDLKNTRIYDHLSGAATLLLRKAHLLIENENNNRAEQLMNICARFNMGKRLNLIQRGSYERRVHLSALRYNKSFKWHSSPWKKVTGRSPGKYFKKFIHKQSTKKEKSCARSLFREKTKPVHKMQIQKVKNIDYGVNVDEPEEQEDLDFMEMEVEALMHQLQVSKEEISEIEKNTVGQFGNSAYEHHREKRLTASLFGRIIKRRAYTSCHNVVKTCLQPTPFHSEATEYGIIKEPVAIKLFEDLKKMKVRKSGLWICEKYGFLGASPDGIVGSDAIVEVKCIHAPNAEINNIEDLIRERKSQMCLKVSNGNITLKRQHSYYHQIQGQLNICQKNKCYFILYINDKIPIFVEEIRKDVEFWEKKMLPELRRFYKDCIGPEIIRGNLKRGKKCVDPLYIQEAIKNKNENLKKNK